MFMVVYLHLVRKVSKSGGVLMCIFYNTNFCQHCTVAIGMYCLYATALDRMEFGSPFQDQRLYKKILI